MRDRPQPCVDSSHYRVSDSSVAKFSRSIRYFCTSPAPTFPIHAPSPPARAPSSPARAPWATAQPLLVHRRRSLRGSEAHHDPFVAVHAPSIPAIISPNRYPSGYLRRSRAPLIPGCWGSGGLPAMTVACLAKLRLLKRRKLPGLPGSRKLRRTGGDVRIQLSFRPS